MPNVSEELLEWAAGLKPWQRDALRRFVGCSALTAEDEEDVLRILKAEHGIKLSPPPPTPVPLSVEHLPVASDSDIIRLKAIANVQRANQLAAGKRLDFVPTGLTIVYGENGSGKSGFIRILRNACRCRLSSVDGRVLPILSNIYGPAVTGPATAELHVSVGGADQVLQWRDREPAPAILSQIAIFDSQAAALYVDESNHIAFLPFNLDLFFKLNTLCGNLKARLDKEHQELRAALGGIMTKVDPETAAGKFLARLSAETTSSEVDEALRWTEDDQRRARELDRLLDNPSRAATDLESLASWIEGVAAIISPLEAALTDESVSHLRAAMNEASEARAAADAMAAGAFAGDHLGGVGSESWRRMYLAARDYSLAEAYPDRPFPILDDGCRCVFCQQALSADAVDRLQRFENFVSGVLARRADEAEKTARAAREAFAAVAMRRPGDYRARLKHLAERDPAAATALDTWVSRADDRYGSVIAAFSSNVWEVTPSLPESVVSRLAANVAKLRADAKALTDALDPAQRTALAAERQELKAHEQLSLIRDAILQRIKDLKLEASLKNCIDATGTTGVTRAAGEFTNRHLTPRLKGLLDEELAALKITHLKPNVLRKPDKKGAQFKVELLPGLKAKTSEILSEGEHRALALASFLAETRSMSDATTIVIDDPVSSLDHERSALVARRLAAEARQRQVIVFTHSLVFYHHINQAAEAVDADPLCVGIFRTVDGTGHIDPTGVPWLGKPVSKRINVLKEKLVQVRKLANGAPDDYGLEVKALYGRIRDCWERLIEEKLFGGVITRFDQAIQTQRLRYVEVPDDIFSRIDAGMTRTSTYSHDNPAAGTTSIPAPDEIAADIKELEDVVAAIAGINKAAEDRRKAL